MTVENQIVLKADEGKYLTNGETVGTVVYLAPNDGKENWREITEEEYQAIKEAEEQELEESEE